MERPNELFNRSRTRPIKKDMKHYRDMDCGWTVPQSYINWQEAVAETDLTGFAAASQLTIHRSYLADNGWMDGMKFIHAVVEDPTGKLFKIKFADNQRWYEEMPSGGWGLMTDPRNANHEIYTPVKGVDIHI